MSSQRGRDGGPPPGPPGRNPSKERSHPGAGGGSNPLSPRPSALSPAVSQTGGRAPSVERGALGHESFQDRRPGESDRPKVIQNRRIDLGPDAYAVENYQPRSLTKSTVNFLNHLPKGYDVVSLAYIDSTRTGAFFGAFDGPDAEDLLADMGFEKMAQLEMPPELKKGPGKMGPAIKTLTPSKFESHVEHVKRPAYTKVGKEVVLRVNSHRVEKYPAGDVWQYDVLVGKGDAEKRATIRAVWQCESMQARLGGGWLFDGNRLAWSHKNIGQQTMLIDMDKEKGRPGRSDGSNSFRVQMRATKKIPMDALQGYLDGKISFSTEVLEAINFIDHLLREWPSQRLISIKRSFFEKSFNGVTWMGGGIDGYKGIYQSIRPAEGGNLVVNADVSNTCFWRGGPLSVLCVELAAPTPEIGICAAMSKADGPLTKMYRNVQRLRKLRVTVDYNNISDRIKSKTFIIAEIMRTSARQTFFDMEDEHGNVTEVSVFDYFQKHYSHKLEKGNLPVVKMTKGQMYPMELVTVPKGQRYPFKLNEFQTAQMIRFAVTRPDVRRGAIEKGLEALDWENDPYHKGYGLRVNPKMLETKARVLMPPAVEFRNGKHEKPGTSGRWRIDGKMFIKPNDQPLARWGVGVFNNWTADPRTRVTEAEVKKFMAEFIRQYQAYGGNVTNTQPPIFFIDDIKKCTEELWHKCSAGTQPPQLMVFVVNAKITYTYNRLKKSCDCRFGVVSQVMQSAHVKKVNGQYIGNVLMKVNSKLGGVAFRANPNSTITQGPKLDPVTLVPPGTMIIGADVSHAGAGSLQPSMAAMTVSMDSLACRFAAACQTNGNHVEMISTWNIYDMLRPLIMEWVSTVGKGSFPGQVMYFRDGVSEGQYQHVLQLEVRDIKSLFRDLDVQQNGRQAGKIKYSVIICSKRHHIRFFPKPGTGDKNGNAFPGTLVERDVTHPTQYDFYLSSHFAIQGTARPVHYHVLVNEMGGNPDLLVKMIYCMCYQYARSSTPVSIIPAVYYAHLASKRATGHDRKEVEEDFKYTGKDLSDLWKLERARTECDRTGKIMTQAAVDRLAQLTRAEYPTLLYMPEGGPDKNRIKFSMWYI